MHLADNTVSVRIENTAKRARAGRHPGRERNSVCRGGRSRLGGRPALGWRRAVVACRGTRGPRRRSRDVSAGCERQDIRPADYYPRFGFSHRLARRLEHPFLPDAFLAMELTAGALDGVEGSVVYAQAFGI